MSLDSLRLAVAKNDLVKVKSLANKAILESDANKLTCIDLAIKYHSNEVGKYLLSLDNICNTSSALTACVEYNNIELLRQLLRTNEMGYCTFKHAIHQKRYEIARYIIRGYSNHWSLSYIEVNESVFSTIPLDIAKFVLQIDIRKQIEPFKWVFGIILFNSSFETGVLQLLLEYLNSYFDPSHIELVYNYISRSPHITDVISKLITNHKFPVEDYLVQNAKIMYSRYGIFYALTEEYNADVIKYILRLTIFN